MQANLYDYQRTAAEFIKNNPRCGLFLDMGLGKACDDETIVLTANRQWQKIKNIKVGDFLYDRQGKPTRVLAVYPHYNINAFRVTLNDNRKFICCNEHLIPYCKNTTVKTKTLSQIRNDYQQKTYRIPQNDAIQLPNIDCTIESYYQYGIDILMTKKKIPDLIKIGSIKNRQELLTGILDNVESLNIITNKTKYKYQYKGVNAEINSLIKTICQSLGLFIKFDLKANMNEIITPYAIHRYHSANIKTIIDEINTDTFTEIINIEKVSNRNMTCFTVDNDEHLYLINDFIVTHNTLVTLTALTELDQSNQLYGNTLVIAPKRIAQLTWPDEIEKWDHTKHIPYHNLTGLTKKKRDDVFDNINAQPKSVYLANREIVQQIVKRFPKKKWPFPNIILDEAQSFKNPKSIRFKQLKTILQYTHRLIELTGTPAPNGLIDIWSLIYMIDGGHRLGNNLDAYKATYFNPGRRTAEGYTYEWFLKKGADVAIHNQIKDVVISMSKQDYLTMPDLIHNVIPCSMTKQERKIYDELKKTHILELIDGNAIEACNAAVLSGALLQLSNGAIYKDSTKSDIINLHNHKLEAMEEIIDGSNNQPILCFYWFKHDLVRLKNQFPDGEIFNGDPEQMKRWNNKEIPLLFAQPASAGHGLNFQYGGHILVFFSIPTSLELYEQAIARLYRNGQTETVVVHYIKTENTVEDIIIKKLMTKQLTQNALIDAVKVAIA